MTSRRTFLGTTTLAALAPSLQATAADADSGSIDAHVHVWTRDTTKYPLARDFTADSMKPESFTPDELFAWCKPHGVTRVVLIQMSFYKYDNRYMIDMMEKFPGVFSGVAIVDDTQPRPYQQMRLLAKAGIRGFRIYSSKEQVAAWGEGMQTMWACAADEGLSMCLLADPGALPAVHEMCKKFPKTPVVIDHFARIGMKGEVNQADLDNLCRLAEFEHTHVKTSAFYALGAKKAPYTDMGPMIRKLRDTFGAQRLMWASDCPFQVQDGHTYADSIALIRDRLDFLTPEDKSWMLRKTAEKVFFS